VRVLHVTWEYPPVVYGGLGQLLGDLAPAQAAAGQQVGVLALGHDVTGAGRLDAAPQREVRDGVRVERVRVPGAPAGTWDGRGLLDAAGALVAPLVAAVTAMPPTDGPVVVHSHDWMTAAAGSAAATALGAGWVHAVHATEFGRRSGRLDGELPRAVHGAERAAVQAFSSARRPDAVLVYSEAMRTEVVGVLGADPGRVHVVPAAVDAARWVAPSADADRARALWVPPDGPLLVAAGRLEWEKGFSTALRALPAMARRHPGVRLVLAGDGSYRPRLEALAEEVGVAGRVVWTGWLEHAPLRALLSVAGAVLATPRYEPFGLVARQAQAAGAPVVVTDVGGLAEAVDPGVTGLRVAAGDVDDLAAQVGTLLADPRRATALGEAGRDAARAWTPAAMAAAVTATYPAPPS
jgi:glycogen(starch) synthase